MKKPLGTYSATTDVVQITAHGWSWSARLSDCYELCDSEQGWCWTEKRAKTKADRAARRMMRAAASWTTRNYKADGSST